MEIIDSLNLFQEAGFNIRTDRDRKITKVIALEFSKSLRRNKERYDYFLAPDNHISYNERAVIDFAYDPWERTKKWNLIKRLKRKDMEYVAVHLVKKDILLTYTLFEKQENKFSEKFKEEGIEFKLKGNFWLPNK